MTRAWDKEKSDSPTGVEPMISRTHGRRSVHRDAKPHGEQGLSSYVTGALHSARISTV